MLAVCSYVSWMEAPILTLLYLTLNPSVHLSEVNTFHVSWMQVHTLCHAHRWVITHSYAS